MEFKKDFPDTEGLAGREKVRGVLDLRRSFLGTGRGLVG